MAARILVAEDQTDIRDLLVMNLRSAGYEVSAVGDGEQAVAQHAERPGDLLMLDLMMPRVDGLELDADDYLIKPFSTPASASRRSTCRTSSTAFFRRARASPRPPARAARASVWRSSSALLNSMLAPPR